VNLAREISPGDLAEKVARTVREEIAAGQLAPGRCVLSERELSSRMRLSRGTVRRGLERLVRDGLLVREAGKGYSLRGPAQAPRGSEAARNAVLFVHHLAEKELADGRRHARIWAGAREEAARSGLLTMISSIPEGELTPRKAEELARVTGGVLCDHSGIESARALLGAGVPVVQLDYYRHPDVPVDAVVQDDSGGIELAVTHLHGRGHRKIGYLDTTGYYRAAGRPLNAARRLSGFAAACAGIGPPVEGLVEPSGEDPRAAVAALLDRGATALVLPHSDLWPGVRAELAGRGAKLPGGFGAVLWGGDQLAAGEEVPTYVTWSKEQMGREGVRRLALRMGRQNVEPATILIPATLVDRGTGGHGPAA
jgi:DNA-binding LacI/PurR family transcriptional regulator